MWYKRIAEYLITNGFVRENVDPNIYIKRELVQQQFVIWALHIDNCIIINNDLNFLNHTKQTLATSFEMTNEGPIKDGDGCLGMVINRNRKDESLSIFQNRYLINILTRFNMIDCKLVCIPIEIGIKLTIAMSPIEPEDIETMKAISYSTAVGSLIHAMTTTVIDLAYSNSQASKFMAILGSIHWSIVKQHHEIY